MPEEVRRRIRNCDGITNESLVIDGVPLERDAPRCPWSEGQITDEDRVAVERHRRRRVLGMWPFAGASADQPAVVVEELEICEEVQRIIEAENVPKPPKQPPPKKAR